MTVGVRLVDGNLALEPGLTVLVLAPELYLPAAKPCRPIPLERRRPGGGRTAPRPDRRPAGDAVRRRLRRRACGTCLCGSRAFRSPTPPGRAACFDGSILELAPGETVALVGPSGAGKSTIAALLLRLLEPTHGRVTVGSVDLAAATRARGGRRSPGCPSGRRSSAARWPTTSVLAIQTAADRARSGGCSACRRGRLHPRPARAVTRRVVGDGGRPLSAGELQRIALARAFLRDAPLRDPRRADREPRSESAELVADAIDRLRDGTHRPPGRPSSRARRPGRPNRAARVGADRRDRGGGGVTQTLRRLGPLAQPPSGPMALSILLGSLAVGFGVALMTTAGYLISRAAEQPPILALTVTIVAVRFFGIARPLARYLERLVSHDAALRALGRIRSRFYERIEPLAPAQLEEYRSGRAARADGRRRRRAPEPLRPRPRTAARRAGCRRGLRRSRRRRPALRRPRSSPSGSSSAACSFLSSPLCSIAPLAADRQAHAPS